jgi:hypothetical protein
MQRLCSGQCALAQPTNNLIILHRYNTMIYYNIINTIPTQLHLYQYCGPESFLQYLALLSLRQLPGDRARMRQPEISNPTHTVYMG